jgi:hypothetical protein
VYLISWRDVAAAEVNNLDTSTYVGERIWVRENVLLTDMVSGTQGKVRAYVRINADDSLTTTR